MRIVFGIILYWCVVVGKFTYASIIRGFDESYHLMVPANKINYGIFIEHKKYQIKFRTIKQSSRY